jgi:hypothetical protein
MVLAKDVLQSPSAQSDIEQKQVAACVGLIDATWEKARALLTSNKTPRSNSVSSEEIEKMFSQFKELTKQQPGVSDSSALSTTSGKVLARILRQQEMKTCVVLTAMLRQEMAQQTGKCKRCCLLYIHCQVHIFTKCRNKVTVDTCLYCTSFSTNNIALC